MNGDIFFASILLFSSIMTGSYLFVYLFFAVYEVFDQLTGVQGSKVYDLVM